MMNFGELTGHVLSVMRDYCAANAAAYSVDKPMAEAWVQQAIYRLDADLLWTQERVQASSVAGQRRYALDDAIRVIQYATYDGAELTALTTIEEIARQEAETSNGTPTHYSWYAQELALYPLPAASTENVIELWTIQTPAALSEAADVPTLPLHTHALLIDYALYQAYRYVGNMELSQGCMGMYAAALQNEAGNYINRRGVMAVRRDARMV